MKRRLTPAQRRALECVLTGSVRWFPVWIRRATLEVLKTHGLIDSGLIQVAGEWRRLWNITAKGRRALANGFYEVTE